MPPRGFAFNRSRHLAVGTMVAVRRWGTDVYGTLGVVVHQDKGVGAEISSRVNAQEARQLANDLNDLADHLEGRVEA
jgi:hypothetical protein